MVLAGFVAACDQGPVSLDNQIPQFDHGVPQPGPIAAEVERLWVCKDGPAGTYDFTVSVTGVGVNFVGAGFSLQAGECVHVASSGNPGTRVVVTEDETTLPMGVVFDHIAVDAVGTVNDNSPGGAIADVEFGLGTPPSGAVITFFNVLDEGGQGCTPGYWKQEHHFDSWMGYSPGDDFDATFGVDLFNPDITLVEALRLGGGGVNAMARHAVAALLNAANDDVSYDLTEAEVIAAVQAAEASGDFEGAKDLFEDFNEQGCPLN
jgi:hypothetical protein